MAMTLSGSGTITGLSAGGLPDATIVQADLAANVASNGPAFSYYQSSAQTLSSNTETKLTFTAQEFDTTGGMYASSRFTPIVAGYYQINGAVVIGASATSVVVTIYKNGGVWKSGTYPVTTNGAAVSALVYLNGSTDYVEIYANVLVGQVLNANSRYTYFQGALVRAA